jgi:DNA-binding transcriptional LysR family regulator
MRITFAQLEAFYWVTQLGTVHQAARHLHIAQPTVSLRLRDLDAAYGAALFERAGRGMRPTGEGQALVARAAAILDEMSKIHEQRGGAELSGNVRVGVAEGFAMVCLPALLDRMRRDFPALRPELVVSTSSGLERDLAAHQLDIAVLVNPIGHPELRLVPLGVQPTYWTAAPSWNLPRRVRPADLRNVPVVCNPPPSASYRQISNWFATAGIEPARMDICSSVALLAHMVASGVAISVLPKKVVEPQVAAGTIMVLEATPAVENGKVYAGFRAGGETGATNAVLRSVRQVLASMDYLILEGQ